jgi:branched-chain amino acid aminotransferase
MIHRYLLHNSNVCEASSATLAPGQIGLLSGWGVFSTIRIFDGVMFEWPRHWQRMKRDAERMRVPFPDQPEFLEAGLEKLIEANHAYNATMRVAVVRNQGGLWEGPGVTRAYDVVAFTANLAHWPERVKLDVAANARFAANEFAGTKYLSWAENLTRYERAHEQGFDEVILLNERSEVAECTSANIFIAEGNRVWTPPISAGCLPGVTRAVLLEDIRVPGIEVTERKLTLDQLAKADEIFITSTTRALLPVAHVEGINIRGGSAVCERLCEAFQEFSRSYVARHIEKHRVPISKAGL